MSTKLKEMREQHSKLIAEARAILDSKEANPAKVKENETKFDAIMVEADALEAKCKREMAVADAEQRAAASLDRAAREHNEKNPAEQKSTEELANEAKQYRSAQNRWMRFGKESLTQEERDVLQRGWISPDSAEARAQSVSGGSPVGIYGGYTVAPEFLRELESAMKFYGGMIDPNTTRVITTATGADMPMPNDDDTGNTGSRLGENQPIAEQDVTFTQTTLHAYKYTSKLIRFSWELLQDSAFDIEAEIATLAGRRLGRILNTEFTTGTGTGQPQGIITGATLGVTGAGSSTLTYDDLVDLEHSVDRAYRGNGKYMFHDTTLKIIRKLKDSQGHPLWQPSLQMGVPDNYNGKQYVINNDMATPASAAKSVLFGDLSKYIVRKVKDYTVVRLVERYAELGQVGFFIWCRYDGRLRDAGQHPVKYLANKTGSP
jgi:HK97 family phage major capsid protein